MERPSSWLCYIGTTLQPKGISIGSTQLLMEWLYTTFLPVASATLQPQYLTEEETHALIGKKQQQQYH